MLRVTQPFDAQTNGQITSDFFCFFIIIRCGSIARRTNDSCFISDEYINYGVFGMDCGSCDHLIGTYNTPPSRAPLSRWDLKWENKHAIVPPRNSQTLHFRFAHSNCLLKLWNLFRISFRFQFPHCSTLRRTFLNEFHSKLAVRSTNKHLPTPKVPQSTLHQKPQNKRNCNFVRRTTN